MQIDLTQYDFLDFGCSTGDSIAFAKDELEGNNGLGLDLNPKKVATAQKAGYHAKVADVTELNHEFVGSVRFVIMSHFLEHLPGKNDAQACIKLGCELAEEFVIIRQPHFDADGYLFSLGFKLYWSNWSGHTYHMTSLELHNVLNPLLRSDKLKRFLIFFKSKISDSDHNAVHPLPSPIDQHEYEEKIHGYKSSTKFFFPVFRETGAIILTKSDRINNSIKNYLDSCIVLFDTK